MKENYSSASQEMEQNDMGTALMGFFMGVISIGGIWFAAGFMWEIVKMVSQA